MLSWTEENYLKALYQLVGDDGKASVNDISKQLGIKMPTVNSMMKRLGEKGLVHYERYQPIQLTDAGRRDAALVIRKHRLTEMFLVEKMGFGWDQVHDIAEQMEHIQSPAFFEKMDVLLGFPKFDPHGSPIPDKHGKVKVSRYKRLSECKSGEKVRLMAVGISDDDFLRFLNSREMGLGELIEIISIEPFDGSMVVSYGNRNPEMFSRMVCENLLVEA
ncbi:MAG: winged helix-turn-helix transcriptional regulator [Bacteroidetes bacterium]|nr:winged helix-turn-helix transcriptional regulator [Bacteroidota bacterium]